jgi:energy-converting hydrogenase Eha subunit E
MNTFLKVTGPKTDLWLVKIVSIFLAVIGVVLIFARIKEEFNTVIIMLAIGSALSLAMIKFVYAKNELSPLFILATR